MTLRRILEAFIKILGVYYAVSAVQQLAFLLALWRAHPPREYNVPLAVIADTPVILSKAVVAAVLLYAGPAIARWLEGRAPAEPETETAPSGADLLYIGTCLVGLVFAMIAIPDVARYAALAAWNAGASGQTRADEVWRGAPTNLLLRSGVGVLAGLVLMRWARPVSAWLDRRADRERGHAPSDTDA